MTTLPVVVRPARCAPSGFSNQSAWGGEGLRPSANPNGAAFRHRKAAWISVTFTGGCVLLAAAPLSFADQHGAAGQSAPPSAAANPQSPHFSTCPAKQITLLSCKLKSGGVASICLDKARSDFTIRLPISRRRSHAILLSDAKQAYFPSAWEPSTVVEWRAQGGYVRLYIQQIVLGTHTATDGFIHRSSRDSIAIIIDIHRKYRELSCDSKSVDEPLAGWPTAIGALSIWQLRSSGLANKLDYDVESEGWPDPDYSGLVRNQP